MHEVKKEAYWNAVDPCDLCDLCCVVKCPWVPPHPWPLDFSHLMLRAKATKFSQGRVGPAEQSLASTDVHGSFAGIPVVVQAVDAINKTRLARSLMDQALGVHPDAWMPSLATQRFRWAAPKTGSATQVIDGKRAPGKVAIVATCLTNYNEPDIGHDLLTLLKRNQGA